MMKLFACSVLIVVIFEECYCISSSKVNMTSSSWGYDYSLSDSRGFAVKHDDKGYQFVPLPNDGGSGFKKQYHSWSINDQFKSPGQSNSQHNSMNVTAQDNAGTANNTAPSNDVPSNAPGPAPVTAPVDFDVPSHSAHSSTINPAHGTPVDTLTDSPSVTNGPQRQITYRDPYVQQNSQKYGAATNPPYNMPQAPSYGTPNGQMYVQQGGPMYGQPIGPMYGPPIGSYGPPIGTYGPPTGPLYGPPIGPAYAPQYGQMYGPMSGPVSNNQYWPMYGSPYRNY